MLIKKSKGCLYLIVPDDEIDTKYLKLVPEAYQANQQHRDSSNYHITIINSQELPDCSYSEKDVDVSFLNLGLAKLEKDDNEVYYLFIYSQTLNKIRKLFGLEKKYYHITLGFKSHDIHDKQRSLTNIILPNQNLNSQEFYKISDMGVLNYLKGDSVIPKLLILELKQDLHGYQSNIDILIQQNNYLGYIFQFVLRKEIGSLERAVDIYCSDLQLKYDPKMIATQNLISQLNKHSMSDHLKYRKTMYYYCKQTRTIKTHEMPRNLSWVIPDRIGGISKIRSMIDLEILKSLGITKIYYFLEKAYFNHLVLDGIEIKYVYCLNTKTPTREDMLSTLRNEEFTSPVLFGCLGGYGRTGTALACYLCHYGINNTQMSSESAVGYLRNLRPKSIENSEQLHYVKEFSNYLFQSISHTNTSTDIVEKVKTPIKFIMLVGLPGAGKTTFGDLFMTSGLSVKILNQRVLKLQRQLERR
jgi:hypothetical protein